MTSKEREIRRIIKKDQRTRQLKKIKLALSIATAVAIGGIVFLGIALANISAGTSVAYAEENVENYVEAKQFTSYEVRKGDTLGEIYSSFPENKSKQAFIDEVVRINHLRSANDILEGQILVIPYISIWVK